PIESENLITMGFPYFEENSKEYQYMMPSSDKTQVLFISQGVIGKYLSKFAYDLSLSLLDESLLIVDEGEKGKNNKSKGYEIIYKLHPGEYETWRENYPHLLETKNLCENTNVSFKIIDDNITPLYELFAKSEYQIGAFSTAIYEGLSFDCKTFVINVPGIEYLDDLIDKQIVTKVNNIEPVLEELKLNKSNNKNSNIFRKIDKDYFFKPYDESIFYRILK
ncbi:MAG: sialyltransferase, partial [archaeon]|nr:sialyltransferase [archaeon]